MKISVIPQALDTSKGRAARNVRGMLGYIGYLDIGYAEYLYLVKAGKYFINFHTGALLSLEKRPSHRRR